MMKIFVSLLSLMTISAIGHEYSANLDYCNVYQERNITWRGDTTELSSSYCCKSCCFITITSAKKCTKNYCENNCPSEGNFDDHECYISQGSESFGCDDENEYCHYVEDTDAYNKYQCTQKKDTTELCDNKYQCLSGRCSTYNATLHDNFCYECVAEVRFQNASYGKERTSHCDDSTQYCGVEDYKCTPKLAVGESCLSNGINNNYMCESNICLDDTNVCGQCQSDSDCEDQDTQYCEASTNQCLQKDGGLGSDCVSDEQCHDAFVCIGTICKGQAEDGEECYDNLACKTGVCNMNSECGSISGVMIDPNRVSSTDDESTDGDASGKKGGKLMLIIIVLLTIIVVIAVAMICQKRKNKDKVQFASQDPQNYRTINGSAATNSVAQSEDLSQKLVTPK